MTDEPPDPLTLPHLKGAALPVLLLLWRFGPQNRQELVQRSGWSPSAVAHALDGLVDAGLVERLHYRAWRLAAPGRAVLEPWLAAADPENPAAGFSVTGPGPVPDAGSAAGNLSAAAPGRSPHAERPPAGLSETSPRRPAAAEEPPAGLSAPARPPEKPPAALSAAASGRDHDHDDDHQIIHIDNHHHEPPPAGHSGLDPPDAAGDDIDNRRYDDRPPAELVRRLFELRPPFTRPEKWLASVPAELVAAWLDYLDDLPPHQRRAISNESAFVRHQVGSGDRPPTRRRPACPVCGRAYFDSDGRCLVCAGIVQL